MKHPLSSSAHKSASMARQRRRGTAAEQAVGRALRALGAAYRKNVRGLPGAPDFANRARKWAVFVNGCFWHAHTGCPRATTPKANRAFWLEKFARNRARDAQAVRALRRAGFRVAIVWECQAQSARAQLSDLLEPRRPNPS
ncbi:MAG TPA: very short patch repair endonuclease [Caulobacteraceae bacterium]|nr:very short patch repair endonuclease [Caulobacteraceae bacterium]